MITAAHPVRWMTAAPLWDGLLARDPGPDELARMQRPAILRLASDDFMEDLAATLEEAPQRVAALEAGPKSYRAAPPGAQPGYAPPIDHVKLYQPVHGHFNLVAATLVCGVAGLPDKAVDTGAEETVGFVMRRAATGSELAWAGGDWVPAPRDGLAPGEQIVSMFPMPYTSGDRRRRLFVGLLPTASLDSFKSGGTVKFSPQPGDRQGPPPDRRPEELDERVIAPLRALVNRKGTDPLPPIDMSRFLMLDLGDFLGRETPQLWQAILARRHPGGSGPAALAFELLRDTWADRSRSITWLLALAQAWAERERIWGDRGPAPTAGADLVHSTMAPDTLRSRVVAALPPRTAKQLEEPQPPFEAPKLDPRPSVRYVVRCVYRRPRCGALHPDLVSDPSRPFAIAPFFDFDAPARPVHISLPVDTSIAGLRKAPKNVRILISNELRSQMSKVKELEQQGQEFDLGMICSFSIPIITICALVVLMIFLYLLNIVFWWLPFFRICFPVPVKKGS